MKNRNEIETKYKWNLDGYALNWLDFGERLDKAKMLSNELTAYEGKLKDTENILQFLKKSSALSLELEILGNYVFLRQKEDGDDSVSEENANRFSQVATQISTALSFGESELMDLSDEFLLKLSKDERFADFSLDILELIRQKPHKLSKAEEKMLSQLSEALGGADDVFDMFDSCDVRFEDVVDKNGTKHALTNANYSEFLESQDICLRRSAHKNLQEGYAKFEKTIGTNYISTLKKLSAMCHIRNFPSSISAAMFYEEVPVCVYDNLIKGVNKNFDIFYKYFDVKKHILGIDDLSIADLYVSVLKAPAKTYTFEEAFDLILKALAPLGEYYISLIKKAKNERYIDVFPTKSKGTGAFSSGAYRKNPVVLLNFNGTVDSVFTLAHELGHSMHSYLSDHSNCYEKAGYEIFVAEVASTTNEMLLLKYLLSRASSRQEKLFYVDKYLSMYKSTVHRQTMFAQFEEFAHGEYESGRPMSCEILSNHYLQLNKKYFGENVVVPNYIRYEWLRIPHFYNAFYVYKYATGLICADVFSEHILSGKTEKYLQFLKSGCTLPPAELLKNAGVDLTDEKTFDEAFEKVNNAVLLLKRLADEN